MFYKRVVILTDGQDIHVHDVPRPVTETQLVPVPLFLKLGWLLRCLRDSHTEMQPRFVSASRSFTTSDVAVSP